MSNEEKQTTDKQFRIKYFVSLMIIKIDSNKAVLTKNRYGLIIQETGTHSLRLFNRIGLDKYDRKYSIKITKKGRHELLKMVKR